MVKKQRSDAQRAADARYAARNPNRQRTLSFRYGTEEANAIEQSITATGMTKADFLRWAVSQAQAQGLCN